MPAPPPYRDLMDYNVAGKEIRRLRKVLVYGTCVRDEYPDIFKQYAEGRVALAVCLEKTHFNMVALKLASMAARVQLDEIVVLTVDGSPHCVQLHMVLEEVAKVLGRELPVRHVVVEKGEAVEVPPQCVKTARYLTRVKKLMEKCGNFNYSYS